MQLALYSRVRSRSSSSIAVLPVATMKIRGLVLPTQTRLASAGVAFGTAPCLVRMSAKKPKSAARAAKSVRPSQKRARSYPRPAPRGRNHLSYNNKWERVQPGSGDDAGACSDLGERVFKHSNDLRPESCPALVLNADFSPLSYMPLSLWPWQEVVKAVFLERVTVVATYDVGVRSPGMIFPLPSVISLKRYQPMAVKTPAFSRFNVFLRDKFSCQYCGQRFPTHELTFDHVLPRCRGGKTNWRNVVTACIRCNHRKGRRLLADINDMLLKRMPFEPSNHQLQTNARAFPPQYLHESWRDYVYWSQSMEEESDNQM